MPTSDKASSQDVRFGYFTVQVRVARSADSVELTGVVEELGTGEKRAFTGERELAQVVAAWGSRNGVVK